MTNRRQWCSASAATAWGVAGLVYLTSEAVASTRYRTPYSYSHTFVSDLGVPSESSLAFLMNTAFCLQGTLFLVGAVFIVCASGTHRAEIFLPLAAANAVGNLMVAAVHSGPAAHADGTIWVHETGAVLAIVGGNAAILVASSIVPRAGEPPWYRDVLVTLSAFGLVSFSLLVIEMRVAAIHVLPPAVWERASVYSITTGQLVTAAYLLTRRR